MTAEISGISFEEFLHRFDGRHAEWVDGKAIVMSPASDRHQDVVGFLAGLLRVFVEANELGALRTAPFLMRITHDSPGREPDLLFVAREHQMRLKRSLLAGPADLVIEIISPESRTKDRREKFYEYEAGGVTEYWLIDPGREQANFYFLDDAGTYRAAGIENGVFRSRVLRGLWLRIDWLWQDPLPPLLAVLREWKLV
ncbi:MAG: Uma2 family endonuclease [Longimicrobiales bacterium]